MLGCQGHFNLASCLPWPQDCKHPSTDKLGRPIPKNNLEASHSLADPYVSPLLTPCEITSTWLPSCIPFGNLTWRSHRDSTSVYVKSQTDDTANCVLWRDYCRIPRPVYSSTDQYKATVALASHPAFRSLHELDSGKCLDNPAWFSFCWWAQTEESHCTLSWLVLMKAVPCWLCL